MPSCAEKKTGTKKSVFISKPQAPQRSGGGGYDGKDGECLDERALSDVEAKLREYSPHTRGRVTAAPGPFIIS